MVRGVLDAPIVTTAIAICFLLCMRGGRAFAACCARSCRNNQPASLAAFASCSRLGVGSDSLTSRGYRSTAGPLSGEAPEKRRRRARHCKYVVMSRYVSTVAAHPVKRHRNSFLLTLQHQQQQQQQQEQHHQRAQGDESTHSTIPTAARAGREGSGAGGDSTADGGSNSGDEQAAGAAVEGAANDNQDGPLALVILNAHGDGESRGLLRHLWSRATLRVCADGGANRLHDSFGGGEGGDSGGGDPAEERAQYVPDIIVGDLDSLRPEVARFYESLGSEIKVRDDQDHCDFEKCLVEVENWLSSSSTSSGAAEAAAAAAAAGRAGDTGASAAGDGSEPRAPAARPGATVVGLGAFGGRFDHEMQAISLLHAYTSRFHRLVLMGAGNVAFLLEPGLSHTIEPDLRFEGPTVGLIPVGGPCRTVTTEGLRWNLDGRGLEFGVCVSSSNLVEEDVVRVTTDAPLVWTAEFKPTAWIEAISSGDRS